MVRLQGQFFVAGRLRQPQELVADIVGLRELCAHGMEDPRAPQCRKLLRLLAEHGAQFAGPSVGLADLRRSESSHGDQRGTERRAQLELPLQLVGAALRLSQEREALRKMFDRLFEGRPFDRAASRHEPKIHGALDQSGL
jgi:hypothetical protein